MILERNNERGQVIVIGAVFIVAILFILMASVQYLNAVRASIANLRVATVASQQMRLGTPYKQGTLNLGAWTARLMGFPDALAVDTEQTFSGIGHLRFTYDDSQTPSRVVAYAQQDLGLLAGFMNQILSGVGLTVVRTEAQMAATSYRSWVGVFADTSMSMMGNVNPVNGAPSPIHKLLQAFRIPETTNVSDPCYPIDTSDATWANFGPAYIAAMDPPPAPGFVATSNNLIRFVCNIRRQLLPGFIFGRAGPMRNRFDMEPPIPGNIVSALPAPREAPYAGLPFTSYNPGILYTENATHPYGQGLAKVPGDNMFACGTRSPRAYPAPPLTGICEPDKGTSGTHPHCFPYKFLDDQLKVNPPGLRGPFTDYEFADPNSNCSFSDAWSDTAGCTPTNISYTDNFLCWQAWNGTPFWFSDDELAWCGSGGTPPPSGELPGSGNQCFTQLGFLYTHYSDWWTTYTTLVSAFMIGLADVVPLLDFNSVSGPTASGPISNQILNSDGTSSGFRKTGVYNIYSSVEALDDGGVGHIYKDPIDAKLPELTTVPVMGNDGNPVNINQFSYYPGDSRLNELLPHLDRTHWPKTNPGIRPGLPAAMAKALTPGGSIASGGRAFIAPLDNPNHPFVDAANYPYIMPPGACATWEHAPVGRHPTSFQSPAYSFFDAGDVWNDGANRWIPSPGVQQDIDSFLAPRAPEHGFSYHPAWSGMFDWWPLKAVWYRGANKGMQPGAQYEEENIKNYAMCIFNYLLKTWGGTDWLGGSEVANREYQKALHSPYVTNGSLPGATLFITDGAPDLTTVGGLDGNLTGAPMTNAEQRDAIAAQLQTLNTAGVFTILLFIQRSTPTLDQNLFIDLFNHSMYPKRAAFVINVSNPSNFADEFARALAMIRVMIFNVTKFVR